MPDLRAQLAVAATRDSERWALAPDGPDWRLTIDARDGSRLVASLGPAQIPSLADAPTSTFPPPSLVTPRLVLRRPIVADADVIFERYATDPEVTRFMTWAPHTGPDVTRAWVEGALMPAWETGRGERTWVICLHDDPRPIGTIGASNRSGVCLGYVLARPWWGRGLMSEAVRAVADAALRAPDIFRVWAYHDIDNVGSGRALEKAGFHREGVLRRWAIAPTLGPTPRDCVIWSRVRPTDRDEPDRSSTPDLSA